MQASYWLSLLGGMLIGLSAAMLMLLNGRVAGISGIFAGILRRPTMASLANAAFVIGLMTGPALYFLASGTWPAVTITSSVPLLVAAGLLVGWGTRMGSGCTSGHGVSGLARLSPRSMTAVAAFLVTAMVTVLVMRSLS